MHICRESSEPGRPRRACCRRFRTIPDRRFRALPDRRCRKRDRDYPQLWLPSLTSSFFLELCRHRAPERALQRDPEFICGQTWQILLRILQHFFKRRVALKEQFRKEPNIVKCLAVKCQPKMPQPTTRTDVGQTIFFFTADSVRRGVPFFSMFLRLFSCLCTTSNYSEKR